MSAHLTKPINVPEHDEILGTGMKPSANGQAAPCANTAPAPATPPRLPGIDTTVGLAQTGKVALYLRMLAKFRDGQARTFVALIRKALDQDDWTLATRQAHSLKGVARTLGAETLGQAALALEEACEVKDAAQVNPCLTTLEQELEQVVAGLKACPELAANDTGAPQPSNSKGGQA
jgi:HPt (histidine-containing phosphotransfer) domain-containing protein